MTKLRDARDHIYKLEFRIADLTVGLARIASWAKPASVDKVALLVSLEEISKIANGLLESTE